LKSVTAASTQTAVRPVYFPQTFLPPETLAALRLVFRSLTVVQPPPPGLPAEMQPFADKGFLDVLRPSTGSGHAEVLLDYQRWAERHHGGIGVAAAWRQERSAADALGAEGTLFEIAAAIRRGASPGGSAVAADPLRSAELFLRLAQDADRQQYQLSRALAACDRRHDRLFDGLRGEVRPATDGASFPAAGGDHMPERLAAWARVFLSLPCALPVFVTHHAEAVEWLSERSPASLRVALEALPGLLPELTPSGGAPDGGDAVAVLTALGRSPLNAAVGSGADARLPAVHIWAETPPALFFARVLCDDAATTPGGGEPGRHALVVQMPAGAPHIE
jgi:hypothetical protein